MLRGLCLSGHCVRACGSGEVAHHLEALVDDLEGRAHRRVEQLVDPLTGGLPPLRVLLLDRGRRTGVDRVLETLVEIGELARRGVDVRRGVVVLNFHDLQVLVRLQS